jgi:hypothetical protein
MRTRTSLAGLAILATAFSSGCASKGYQRSENLADEIHATVAAVDAYGVSRQASFESMNALVAEPLESLPARFEKFNSSVDRVVSADGSLRGSLAKMKTSANERFKEWGEQNVSYADNDMQLQSQKNRADATGPFRKAVDDTDAMLEQSTGFVTYLTDLRKILANDLSPKGVASVSEFTAKARVSNAQLDELARPARTSLGAAADAMTSKTPSKQ